MGVWRRFTELYSRILSILVVTSLVILIVPVSMQIFSRFTHIIPHYIWTEEMARFLFVWTIMLGAILGVREGSHLVVDVWPRMAPRPEAALRLLSSVAVLTMALVFVWAGIEFTQFAWHRISELAELPLWLIHVAWPVAGVSWLVFLGEQFYDDLRVLVGRTP
jgi:TRAP-type C4-dicarboxylate transport system permease small subunit